MADSLLYGWQLHIVAIELAEIAVISSEQVDGKVLEGLLYDTLEPFSGEDLTAAIAATICHDIRGGLKVMASAYLFHAAENSVSIPLACKETNSFSEEPSPFLP